MPVLIAEHILSTWLCRVVTRPMSVNNGIEITTPTTALSLRAAGFVPAQDVIEVGPDCMTA
jgi:hypothetical protein